MEKNRERNFVTAREKDSKGGLDSRLCRVKDDDTAWGTKNYATARRDSLPSGIYNREALDIFAKLYLRETVRLEGGRKIYDIFRRQTFDAYRWKIFEA